MALARVNTGDPGVASNIDQFIDFITGVMTDQPAIFGNSFKAQGSVSLNKPSTNIEADAGNVNLYADVASSGASGGRLSVTSNGPTGNDGGYLEWVPATAGNTANRLNITGSGASQLAELVLASASVRLGPNGTGTAPGICIRGDNSTADPGIPWIRADGTNIVVNGRSGGGVFLAWDSVGSTNLGGILTVAGATMTLNGSPAFCVDWGMYDQNSGSPYGGGTYNFAVNTNRNFNGRTPLVIVMCRTPGIACTGVGNSNNTMTFTQTSGSSGVHYQFNWIAIG